MRKYTVEIEVTQSYEVEVYADSEDEIERADGWDAIIADMRPCAESLDVTCRGDEDHDGPVPEGELCIDEWGTVSECEEYDEEPGGSEPVDPNQKQLL